jgi:hypothetical protein
VSILYLETAAERTRVESYSGGMSLILKAEAEVKADGTAADMVYYRMSSCHMI